MPRTRLRDDQWERIKDVLPWQRHRLRDDGLGQSPVYRGRVVDCADRQSVARLSPRLRELACDVYALLAVGEERRVAADHHDDPP